MKQRKKYSPRQYSHFFAISLFSLFSILLLNPLFNSSLLNAAREHEIKKTFDKKDNIQLNTFAGDCVVKKNSGNQIEILFVHTYSKMKFEPQFIENGDTLILKEKFRISDSGSSTWYLTIPDKTSIKYTSLSGNISITGINSSIYAKSVSGDLNIKDCGGSLDLRSISGDIKLENISGNTRVRSTSSDLKVNSLTGELEIKSNTGDIDLKDLNATVTIKGPSSDIDIKKSTGTFKVLSASGDITADLMIFKLDSDFKTASGDVHISLAAPLDNALSLGSASGDAVLNYNGIPIDDGLFIFKCIKDKGEIFAPFAFDKEEEEQKWGKTYSIKSTKRIIEIPKILIYTATGKAALKEK
jgi:hypothetical protein